MNKLVVLTGAGMSAESGIRTFRDSDGLWEEYNVMDVCTPEAWQRDPELVNRFYNERRKQLYEAKPNAGHYGLAELEKDFDVRIITQNIDDLHERAGSTNVLHLHGELKKVRSSRNPNLIYDLDGWELKLGTKAKDGSILRPHIVWFGRIRSEHRTGHRTRSTSRYSRDHRDLASRVSGCQPVTLCTCRLSHPVDRPENSGKCQKQ